MKPKAPLTSWRHAPPHSPDEKTTADLLRVAGEPDALSPEAHARISRRLREPPRRRLLALPDMRMALAAGGLALALVVGSASVVLLEHSDSFKGIHAAPRPDRFAEAPRPEVAAAAPPAGEPAPQSVAGLLDEGQATSSGPAKQMLAKAPARLPGKAAKDDDFAAMDRSVPEVDDKPALAHHGGGGPSDNAKGGEALALRERAKAGTFEPSELSADSARGTGSPRPPLFAAAPEAAPPPASAAAASPAAASGAIAVAARRESAEEAVEKKKSDGAAARDSAALPPMPSSEVCAHLLQSRGDLPAQPASGEGTSDLGPTGDTALLDRARCRLRAGQRDAAREDLRRYLELEPNGPYTDAARALLAR